jgi:hypothetical protein
VSCANAHETFIRKRAPKIYDLIATSGYFLGIDTGKQNLTFGICDFCGNIVAEPELIHFDYQDTPECFDRFINLINEYIQRSGIARSQIKKACMSIGGRVNPETGCAYNYFTCTTMPLAEALTERLDLPFCIDNDTRCMTYGEYLKGVCKGLKNIIFVNVSWGIGIGYFYGYKVEGVYQTDEEIARSPKNTLATVTPGDLKFKDVNGDGEITTADRTLIGDPTPNVTYGIALGVSYKNWELGIDMMGQGGNQIFRTWDNYNWSQFNFMEQRMDRWHGPGTSNTQPLLNTKHTINNMNSEYYIEDGSFFRIRNVQLAYNFDKTLISRIGMQALKLYVNIQNLKTWKHNTGYTPELGGTAIAFGVDDGSYPMPAIYTFGFNLTF